MALEPHQSRTSGRQESTSPHLRPASCFSFLTCSILETKQRLFRFEDQDLMVKAALRSGNPA
jgi:hypothetical protein